jgi:hypothetical protein
MAIEAATEQIAPPRPRSRGITVPAGACDTHAHVLAPAGIYPYAEKRPHAPAPGTDLAADRRVLQPVGIDARSWSIPTSPARTTRDHRRAR